MRLEKDSVRELEPGGALSYMVELKEMTYSPTGILAEQLYYIDENEKLDETQIKTTCTIIRKNKIHKNMKKPNQTSLEFIKTLLNSFES